MDYKFIALIIATIILFTVLTTQGEQRDEKIIETYNYFVEAGYDDETAKTIVALAVLESGWFSAEIHVDKNNWFSIKDFKHPLCSSRPIKCLRRFESSHDCFEYMVEYFDNRDFPRENRSEFLDRLEVIGYAEDPDHRRKVETVSNMIDRRL